MASLKTVLAFLLALAVIALLAFGWRLYAGKNDSWIRDRSEAASSRVSSYFYTMSVSSKTAGVIEGAEVDIVGSMAGNVSIDLERRFMHGRVKVNVSGSSGGEPIATYSEIDVYVVNETLYSQAGGFWVKQKLGEEAWGETQLSREGKATESAEVRLAGVEAIREVECYVLEFKPDVKAMSDYVEISGNTPSEGDAGEEVEGYAVREWVSTESFLPLKTVTEFTVKSGGVKTEVNVNVDYYDYGRPFAMEIPREALEAEDAASAVMMFSP